MSAPSRNLGSGCTNCYAIPLGTGQNWDAGLERHRPGSWADASHGPRPRLVELQHAGQFAAPTGSGTSSIRIDIAWYDARQERNGGHITVDQRLTSNISFYGSGFYSNRRGHYLNPSNLSPSATNIIAGVAVPTFNPYYPIGNAPNNLRAYYNIGWESPGITTFYELAQRYQLGLNIALPGDWSGRVWYSMTKDANFNIVQRSRQQERGLGGARAGPSERARPSGTHARDRAPGRSPATFPI